MEYSHKLHGRRSIRLKEYDYSSPGAYFVTICTYNRKCFFGNVRDVRLILSAVGRKAKTFFREIPEHFENITLDEYVVMPNHLHGIIVIQNVGVQNFEPLQRHNAFQHLVPKSLGSVIRTYKSMLTRWCRINGHRYFKWQRNYYEHIIRDEDDLNKIREYIQNNPLEWHLDIENPKAVAKDKQEGKSLW
jgi:REP element-mobilizing transposase RayT